MTMEVLKEQDRIYLDYNATTPLAGFLKENIAQWMDIWGNPSSTHQTARQARTLVWSAREKVAKLIGCHPLEIIFTSCGSESNNYAIKGLCEKFANTSRNKIITSSVEHPSVRQTLEWAKKRGFQIKVIPVSKEGHFDLEKFKTALDNQTAFVTIMYANNETGCLLPVQKIRELSLQKGCLFHCDAVQVLGKQPIHARDSGIDLLTFSAHKFYALKGCGFLYCKKGLHLDSLIHGGTQERKRRAGTENVLSIGSLGAVAERGEEILQENKKIKTLRDEMEARLLKLIPDIQVIGEKSNRLGNTSSLWVSGVYAETVMMNLDLKGYSVSVSSACHSGSLSPSAVLLGMGYSPEEAQCILRVSLGLGVNQGALQKFVLDLKQIVERLRHLGK